MTSEGKMIRLKGKTKVSMIIALIALILSLGIYPIAQSSTDTSSTTVTTSNATATSTSTQQSTSSQDAQTVAENLQSTFAAVISDLKEKGYNTTELEQTVQNMVLAIENGNYALGRAYFIKAVNLVYSLEVGKSLFNQTQIMQRTQEEIMRRITELNQSISNMSFLSADVRSNLTQQLNLAMQLVQNGNYSAAVQYMEKVMVQLRDMANSLNRERVRTMLIERAMNRADEINGIFGIGVVDKNKLNESNESIMDLALKARGLGVMKKYLDEDLESMNASWIANNFDEGSFKGKLGNAMIGKAKSMPEQMFAPSSILLQIAEENLQKLSKFGRGNLETYANQLQGIIDNEKSLINASSDAVSKLMQGDVSALSVINQSKASAQALIEQVNSLSVPGELQSVKTLIARSLQLFIDELNAVQRVSSELSGISKNILIKGIVLDVNGQNLTVLGVFSPGSLVMGGQRFGTISTHHIVLLPTNWTVILTNSTQVSGQITVYAPVLVHGSVVDAANHVVKADKIFTNNATIEETEEGQ